MKFWIFMFSMNMILPLVMLIFGKYFVKQAPKEINVIFGYRSNRSMKNKDTWDFAHHYVGQLWFKWGWTLLIISTLMMMVIFNGSEKTVGIYGGLLSGAQLLVLLGSIFPTEKALKDTFDDEGNRRIR